MWYYTDSPPHGDHDQMITSSLTRSPTSKIKCETQLQTSVIVCLRPFKAIVSPPPCTSSSAVHSPSHQLQQLRLVKSPSEIALMKRAADITCQAFTQVQAVYLHTTPSPLACVCLCVCRQCRPQLQVSMNINWSQYSSTL